jgi:hypothetical protein
MQRKPVLARCFYTLLATLILVSTSNADFTVIDYPGGGQIVYGPTSGDTVQGAMGAVLRKVHDHFGERPQVGRFFCQQQCALMGTFFNVTNKSDGKQYSGMAIVSQENGQSNGAVIYSEAGKFAANFNPMLQRLKQEWKPAPPSPSAAGTPATGPVATLHKTGFPDGSGNIDLPDGWQLVSAHGGAFEAHGPRGEEVIFGRYFSVIDTSSPQQRQRVAMETQNGRIPLPGMYVAIPYGTGPVQALQSVAIQFAQKLRRPAPTITAQNIEQGTSSAGVPATIIKASIDRHDGKGLLTASLQVSTSPPGRMGSWAMAVNQIDAPPEVFEQERATLQAIAASWRINSAVIGQEVSQQIAASTAYTNAVLEHGRQSQAYTQNVLDQARAASDASERQVQGFCNNLLDQSVIRDTGNRYHGTFDNDFADAVVKSNPTRFEYVPPSQYVKGIDY